MDQFPDLKTANKFTKKQQKKLNADAASFIPSSASASSCFSLSTFPPKRNNNVADQRGYNDFHNNLKETAKETQSVKGTNAIHNDLKETVTETQSVRGTNAIHNDLKETVKETQSVRGSNANGTVKLPVDDYHDEIVKKADESDVLIVQGDTGCGKSSRVPTFLRETAHFRKNPSGSGTRVNNDVCDSSGGVCSGRSIFVTQPRRIAAVSLAERVSREIGDVDERGFPTFKRVGYAIGQERRFTDSLTEIVFCTCGWLLQKLLNDSDYAFRQLSYIVIDEAHERDIDMDLLLFVAKILLRRFKGSIKFVLMSATLNYDAFENYFPGKLALVNINMRRFPVAIGHLCNLDKLTTLFPSESSVERFQTAMFEGKCKEDVLGHISGIKHLCIDVILANMQPGATETVLVFLSGIQQIDQCYEKLASASVGKDDVVEIFMLHSSIEHDELMAVFDDGKNDEKEKRRLRIVDDGKNDEKEKKRLRIVLSTNIAESSVTIPNVSVVIDLGTQKIMKSSRENAEMMELVEVSISRAAANQRAGRTGRVCPGTVVRFYTESTYDTFFDEHNKSEIQLVPKDQTVLRFFGMKRANSSQLSELNDPLSCISQLVDPPHAYDVEEAYLRLIRLGALVEHEQLEKPKEKKENGNDDDDEDDSDSSSSASASSYPLSQHMIVRKNPKNVHITNFGLLLIRLPLSFAHSEFALFGSQFHRYAAHFAIMAAFVSNADIWINPNHNDKQKERYQSMLRATTFGRMYFARKHGSDLLSAVEIVREMLSFDRRRGNRQYWRWLSQYGFHEKAIAQFLALSLDVMRRLGEAGFKSAEIAYRSVQNRRFRTAPLDQQTIDAILPMTTHDSSCCAVIVGWALQRNLVQSTEGKYRRIVPTVEDLAMLHEAEKSNDDDSGLYFGVNLDDVKDQKKKEEIQKKQRLFELISDKDRYDTIQMSLCLEIQDAGAQVNEKTVSDLVLRIVGTCIGPLVSEHKPVSMEKASSSAKAQGGQKTWISTYYARFVPVDVEYFAHFLRQFLYKNRGTLNYSVGGKAFALLTLSNVSLPEMFEYESKGVRTFDFPPRSRLHNLPISAAIRSVSLKTSSVFTPGDSCHVVGVSPTFTKNGRSYRAPLISLIPTDCQFVFAAVARFTGDISEDAARSLNIYRKSNFVDAYASRHDNKNNGKDEQKMVETTHFRSVPLDANQVGAFCNVFCVVAQPLVEFLHSWTMAEITDVQRSQSISAALDNLISATFQ